MTECELWVLVNAEGEYAASDDADHVRERYGEVVGELAEADGFRLVRVTVKVPTPKVIEAAAEVAEDEPAVAAAA